MAYKTRSNITVVVSFALCLSLSAFGQVRLPRLISDGMVLQRNTEVKMWGWAARGENVAVRFVDSTYHAITDSSGAWSIVLAHLEPGGPFDMQIQSDLPAGQTGNSITIHDILIGDVWLCSGQSNMELSMNRASPIYEDEIAHSENPRIRQFLVPQRYDFNAPHDDLGSGAWVGVNPKTVLDFSAVAYFFGKEVNDKYGVPVGLINASLGGSPAEAWMSEDALKEFPAYYNEALKFKDSTLIKQIESSDNSRIQAWNSLLRQKDEGYRDPRCPWYDPTLKETDWAVMDIPGYWADTKLGGVNGVVWFRRTFTVPTSMLGLRAKLNLGRIVDADSVYVNGVFIGTTSYQYPPRRYVIPSDVLKEGENTIVVRIINSADKGGFVLDKAYEIVVGKETIDLRGKWRYRLGATMEPLASQTFIRWKPLGLYNAMIAPLLNYRIMGAVWYQGEANTRSAFEYRTLLPAMIGNWRNDWKEGNFPFVFAQLPNFMEAKSQPSESDWAMLRESQLKTLAVPNTAMGVTIDLGEWNDIHPLNKKDVSKRLFLGAQRIAYGDEDVIASGPLYDSMRIDGQKVILTFSNIGGGLISKGNAELQCFAVAGADRKFDWANARIEGNSVVIWSDKVLNPVAVRYAWADNPDGANLYNVEGLPASPFRTDDWTVK